MNFVGTATAGKAPFTRVWARLSAPTISQTWAQAIAILCLVPILLAVALWNGFPFIFYDTGAYILEGLGHVFVAERGPVYSFILRYAGAATSLWYIALLQAAITALVLTEIVRAEAPDLRVWRLLAFVFALCLLTGIGWYVGQIEPDCFAAVAVIAVYLLAFRFQRLGVIRLTLLIATATLAVASHPAHLGLAAGLLAWIALLRLASGAFPALGLVRPKLSAPTASYVLALALVLQSNHELTNEYFVSKSGPVFAFARMLQDGLIKQDLDETCPSSHYHLCAYKDHLPDRADAFLWDANSPFNKLRRFSGPTDEYRRIVIDSILRHPLGNLTAALSDTARQFITFRTGDQIEPQEWILYSDLAHYVPRQMNAYMSARQQQGQLTFVALNIVHVGVAYLSLLGLVLILWLSLVASDWRRANLPAFIFVALLANAFVCGVFSNPHDRYQSRLIWVPSFVLLISAAKYGPDVLAKLNRIRQLMAHG